WSRTGGVDFGKVQTHVNNGTYDFLIIKAGQGLVESVTFKEQIQGAEQKGIPYTTYYFLDPNRDIEKQAKHYVNLVGKEQPSYIVDVEIPYSPDEGGRLPRRTELRNFLDELEMHSQRRPIIYSSMHILRQIRFLSAAENYKLWIAQYLWDRSIYPNKTVLYNYFHDFLDDYAGTLPPSAQGTSLAKNVLLWQFSSKGNGYHYIFNKHTNDPRFPVGKKSADLNVSIQKRDEFMPMMFGATPIVITPEVEPVEEPAGQPTYAGMTNQDMVNLFLEASSLNQYWEWIEAAQLEYMAIPRENRSKPYTGPKIEDLPNLSGADKAVLLAALDGGPPEPVVQPTYPGMTNQDMINLFLEASSLNQYWEWIVEAQLEHMAVPEQNRGKLYTGPKVEDLPNLSAAKKAAILAAM
ncbi:MAG: hypothetical protein KAS36_13290, partial [Anaerolineales bacterium]|nr:hypothetical protein [Anaerolineales bacterium]